MNSGWKTVDFHVVGLVPDVQEYLVCILRFT